MLLKRHGIREVNVHGIRHTFATRALESGMSIKTLSQFHRHLTISLEYGEDSAQDSALLQLLQFLKTILLLQIPSNQG
jgi:integrase